MYSQIQELMTKIGPIADYPAIQEFSDAKAFLVAISEELIIEAHAVEARGLLLLVADLGKPVRDTTGNVGQIALGYASLWKDNDGSYLGIDPASGHARLHCPIAVSSLDPDRLVAHIGAFADRALGWKAALAGASASLENRETLKNTDHMIRG